MNSQPTSPTEADNELVQMLLREYQKPDPNPILYMPGQSVRLKKGRSDDGQTPAYWDGAVVVVMSFYVTGLHKDHWYKLRHDNGQVAEFKEDEIDRRYSRTR